MKSYLYKEKEIKGIDGLRALAILMVIMAHLVDVNSGSLSNFFVEALDLGKEGVTLFFSISGFIISFLLIKEKQKSGTISFNNFITRRTLKIIPVLYIFLIFLVALNMFGMVHISPDNFLSSFFFYRNYSNSAYSSFTGHIWSLAVEEHFYLFWPLVIFLLDDKKLKWFIWFVILISPILRIVTFLKFPEARARQDIMTHCRLDGFMFGALLAREYYTDQLSRFTSYFRSPKLWLFILGILYFCVLPTLKYHSFKGYWLVIGLGLNAIISTLILGLTIIQKEGLSYDFLNSKILRHIGIISYSLYVWQEFAIYYISNIPIALISSYVLGLSSFVLVEQSFEKIKKSLVR